MLIIFLIFGLFFFWMNEALKSCFSSFGDAILKFLEADLMIPISIKINFFKIKHFMTMFSTKYCCFFYFLEWRLFFFKKMVLHFGTSRSAFQSKSQKSSSFDDGFEGRHNLFWQNVKTDRFLHMKLIVYKLSNYVVLFFWM